MLKLQDYGATQQRKQNATRQRGNVGNTRLDVFFSVGFCMVLPWILQIRGYQVHSCLRWSAPTNPDQVCLGKGMLEKVQSWKH